MSFLNKLGMNRKHDDFSLDDLPPDPQGDTTPSFDQSSDSFSEPQQTQNFPSYENSAESIPATPGQRMAQDFMQKQEVSQPVSQPSQSNDKMELINVKLDAIRSELVSLGHRMTQLEQKVDGKKRQW